MIRELRVTLQVLTPLFLGGAEQQAELRAPGIKGPLRYWYRAADPRFGAPWTPGARLTREDRFFGGTRPGAGQSPFLLRVEQSQPAMKTWGEFNARRFDVGRGRDTRNGLEYLGYPFRMGNNTSRKAIVPGETFQVRSVMPRPVDPDPDFDKELRRALVASWWLLCHLGGLGSRSRRGFGAVGLVQWEGIGGNWPELDQLPLPARADHTSDWRRDFEVGLSIIRQWFHSEECTWAEDTHHPHLGQGWRWILMEPGRSAKQWDAALADAGARMQGFRLRRAPDYQNVKDHMLAGQRKGGGFMRVAPERTSFGLPLTFRFTSAKGPPVTFVPHNSGGGGHFERHGSLLHLRLVTVGAQVQPLFARLDGAVPGEHPPALVRGEAIPLGPFAANAMDGFMDSLS